MLLDWLPFGGLGVIQTETTCKLIVCFTYLSLAERAGGGESVQ